MAIDPELDDDQDWEDEDDSELDLNMNEDEDLDFSDFEDDDDVDMASAAEDARARTPLWRLIEMSKENRSLKMQLADFEDYEIDGLVDEYSY